jgi:hypothetical protein
LIRAHFRECKGLCKKTSDLRKFTVETAPIAFYDCLYSHPTPPTSFVYCTGSSITGATGEEEPAEEPKPVTVDEMVPKYQDILRWFPIAGFELAALAFIFLMLLIVLSLLGQRDPSDEQVYSGRVSCAEH